MDKEDPRNWLLPDFEALHDPFPAEDIEWRVQSCGSGTRGIWAIVIPYIQARAIFDRLDAVCKPENWQSKIKEGDKCFLAGIGIRIRDEWIWKWDGAQTTDIEAIKGGISGAMKRAGVPWGIGRYMYNLNATFANICEDGANNGKLKDGTKFKWNPPKLPIWALPEGQGVIGDKTPTDDEKVPENGSEDARGKTIEVVVADINKCTSFRHLQNIFEKYERIFEGEDKTTLIRAKDVKKGELS